MQSRTRLMSQVVVGFAILLLGIVLLGRCTGGDENTVADDAEPTQAAEAQQDDRSQDGVDPDGTTQDGAGQSDPEEPTDETAQGATRQLADDDPASVETVAAGDTITDAAGNLVVVHGAAMWPTAFDTMSEQAREQFPFLPDVAGSLGGDEQLIALDVSMCAAGIDATGAGTAAFTVHKSKDEPLSDASSLSLSSADYPIATPVFLLPGSAECARGWQTLVLDREAEGAQANVARYVLSSRNGASIEQHVYQWELDELDSVEPLVSTASESSAYPQPFGVTARRGQTVTFRQGPLASGTVELNGWAELVGVDSPIADTRQIAVSFTPCAIEAEPAQAATIVIGLGIDGWQVVAPLAAIPELDSCEEVWVDFAIPYQAQPTSFFLADGTGASSGYAQWSLQGAAIAAPPSEG